MLCTAHLTFAMFSTKTEQCSGCSTYGHLTAPAFQNPFIIRKYKKLAGAQCISLDFLFSAITAITCRKHFSPSFRVQIEGFYFINKVQNSKED